MEYNENGQVSNRRRRFFPTISFGNILTGVLICSAAIGVYTSVIADVREHKADIANLKQQTIKQEAIEAASRREIKDDIKDVKSEIKELRETMQKILSEIQQRNR